MKTATSLPQRASAALFAAAALVLAGCAHHAQAPVPGPDGKILLVEYDQVYVTGSHIPVLVPRSATVRTEPGISPLTTLTPDQMRQIAPHLMH
jgi:hypothetical protein